METQNLKQALGSELSAQRPDVGLELTNHEIMTCAEVGHLTDWATQMPPQNTLYYGQKEAMGIQPGCAGSLGAVRGGKIRRGATALPSPMGWETGLDAQHKKEWQKSETSKESSWKSGAWKGGTHPPNLSPVVLDWKGCSKVPWAVFSNLITSLSCHQRTDWNLWRGRPKSNILTLSLHNSQIWINMFVYPVPHIHSCLR